MSELTEAIEAAAQAISVYDWDRGLSGNPEISKHQRAEATAAINAAEAIIRADERAKVTEEIGQRGQAILRVLLEEHLLVNGKCYPSHCGDPDDHIWSEHVAEVWRQRVNGAIARQHASARPEDPSHKNSADTPGEQPLGDTNEAPRSHVETRTAPPPYERTPKPAQGN